MQSSVFQKTRMYLIVLLAISILGATIYACKFINKPVRDKSLYTDLESISITVPVGETISVSPNLYSDWALRAYAYRLSHISLNNEKPHVFLLADKAFKDKSVEGYALINVSPSGMYSLYKKK